MSSHVPQVSLLAARIPSSSNSNSSHSNNNNRSHSSLTRSYPYHPISSSNLRQARIQAYPICRVRHLVYVVVGVQAAEVVPHHPYHLPANSDLTQTTFRRLVLTPRPQHLRAILPLRRAMRRRQGPVCRPLEAAVRHRGALPCRATLRQTTFPRWVVALRLHNNNRHSSNNSPLRANNNLRHHRTMAIPPD